jgi:hypothetical protein
VRSRVPSSTVPAEKDTKIATKNASTTWSVSSRPTSAPAKMPLAASGTATSGARRRRANPKPKMLASASDSASFPPVRSVTKTISAHSSR